MSPYKRRLHTTVIMRAKVVDVYRLLANVRIFEFEQKLSRKQERGNGKFRVAAAHAALTLMLNPCCCISPKRISAALKPGALDLLDLQHTGYPKLCLTTDRREISQQVFSEESE